MSNYLDPSAFGSENKNGCLRTLFHGKHQIHQQLLFNIDVRITLQLLHPTLTMHEDDATMRFIDHVTNAVPRSNMTLICDHTYIIGPCKATTLTPNKVEHFIAMLTVCVIHSQNFLERELCMHQFQETEMVCYEMILFAFSKKTVLFSLD